MNRNTTEGGYFLYHSIGIYPGKEEDLAQAMTEFSEVWSAPNDKQWGYVLRKRQDFIDRWRRLIGVPKGSLTTVDNVTEGLQKILRALPEGMLKAVARPMPSASMAARACPGKTPKTLTASGCPRSCCSRRRSVQCSITFRDF